MSIDIGSRMKSSPRWIVVLLLVVLVLPISIFLSFKVFIAYAEWSFAGKQETITLSADFQRFVTDGNLDAAWSLLSTKAQEKLNKTRFMTAHGDYAVFTDEFRKADITITSQRSLRLEDRARETRVRVPNLRGKPGVVKYITIVENGEWKIANMIEDIEP